MPDELQDKVCALTQRSLANLAQRKLNAALSDCDEAICLRSNDVRLYGIRAEVHYWLGEHAKAIADCDKCIQMDATFPQPWEIRGRVHLAKGEYAKSFSDLDEAVRLAPPEWPGAHVTRARLHFRTGDLEKAINDATKAIEIHKGYPEGWIIRGFVRLARKELALAFSDFSQAIDVTPSAEAFYGRAQVSFERGDHGAALKDVSEAIALGAHSPPLLYLRGYLRCHFQHDYHGAIEDLSEVIRSEPTNGQAYLARARAWRHVGKLQDAMVDLDSAVKFCPNDPYAYLVRGQMFNRQGSHDLAILDCDAAIRLNANLARAYSLRANAYLSKREFQKSLVDLTESIRLQPKNPLAFKLRAQVHRTLGDCSTAKQDERRAQELESAEGEAKRGKEEEKRGKGDAAVFESD